MYFEAWNTKCSLHARDIGLGKTVYVHPRKISPLNPDIYGTTGTLFHCLPSPCQFASLAITHMSLHCSSHGSGE